MKMIWNWLIEHFISQAKISSEELSDEAKKEKAKATRDYNLEGFLVAKTFEVEKMLRYQYQ